MAVNGTDPVAAVIAQWATRKIDPCRVVEVHDAIELRVTPSELARLIRLWCPTPPRVSLPALLEALEPRPDGHVGDDQDGGGS